MSDVDSTVASSIRKLVSVVSAKKTLEQTRIKGLELSEALEALTLDGCRIDNLGLDFTLPGHPTIELRKGGKDTTVTIHNLEEYVKVMHSCGGKNIRFLDDIIFFTAVGGSLDACWRSSTSNGSLAGRI